MGNRGFGAGLGLADRDWGGGGALRCFELCLVTLEKNYKFIVKNVI